MAELDTILRDVDRVVDAHAPFEVQQHQLRTLLQKNADAAPLIAEHLALRLWIRIHVKEVGR